MLPTCIADIVIITQTKCFVHKKDVLFPRKLASTCVIEPQTLDSVHSTHEVGVTIVANESHTFLCEIHTSFFTV